jgi:hypothetical protein
MAALAQPASWAAAQESACLLLLAPFASALLAVVARRPSMFVRRHGRAHRLLGAAHLAWLAAGLADAATFAPGRRAARAAHDAGLGVLGLALTLTAAASFDHRRVVNRASGALDEDATVTHDEMMEHAFYQALNLVQVAYLHAVACVADVRLRVALCLLATAPWAVRAAFPVNSFSANYATSAAPWGRVALLYRLKKAQYLLYKHALLHGLNVSAALDARGATGDYAAALPQQRFFRLFWLCLNAAYVLEFFLQTLVKRRVLRQRAMLRLNALLMAASTLAALPVLRRVQPVAAVASLALNFARRHREVSNTAAVAALTAALGALR